MNRIQKIQQEDKLGDDDVVFPYHPYSRSNMSDAMKYLQHKNSRLSLLHLQLWFHQACRNGDLAIVELLLPKVTKEDEVKYEQKPNILIDGFKLALEHGRYSIVSLLSSMFPERTSNQLLWKKMKYRFEMLYKRHALQYSIANTSDRRHEMNETLKFMAHQMMMK